ncbi:MAG: carbohydrate ABC transporter substrate-binding protein [Chloroflexi bacterium]|nr:carbohydrate ABC transporter substrate-binding protein [Chloroflexota bacterium]
MFPSFSDYRRLLPPAALLLLLLLNACADQTIIVSSAIGEAREAQEKGMVVWARGNMQDHQRADAVTTAIARDAAFDIPAQAMMFHIGAGSYASLWEVANADGRPPDIVSLDMAVLPEWVDKGRLEPLDSCLEERSEFDGVRQSLWPAVTRREQRWGVPHELGVHLLFFNKHTLRELGWSEAEIESLPRRIENGEFSLEDIAIVAGQAVEQGVVKPGFGYWRETRPVSILNHYAAFGGVVTDPNRPNKLILTRSALVQAYAFAQRLREEKILPAKAADASWNRAMGTSVWHDVVSHGLALFWDAPLWNWKRWQGYYMVGSDKQYLEEMAGYALLPGGQRGVPGFAWGETRSYALSASRPQSAKKVSCRILARVTAPDIQLAHVTDNLYLTVLSPDAYSAAQATAYLEQDILRFGESIASSVRLKPVHEDFGRYEEIMWTHMRRVEAGESSPQEAAEAAIEQMQAELDQTLKIDD